MATPKYHCTLPYAPRETPEGQAYYAEQARIYAMLRADLRRECNTDALPPEWEEDIFQSAKNVPGMSTHDEVAEAYKAIAPLVLAAWQRINAGSSDEV